MSSIAVIYKSKYGSTEQYARWIAESCSADLFNIAEAAPDNLEGYDTIVFGGGLYAVNILGISYIKNNYPAIKDKKIIVFSVGASPETQQALVSIKEKNFTEEMLQNIHFFHLRGALLFDKMNPKHRFMMFLLKKQIEKQKPGDRDNDSVQILEAYGKNVTFIDKNLILPILDCIAR